MIGKKAPASRMFHIIKHNSRVILLLVAFSIGGCSRLNTNSAQAGRESASPTTPQPSPLTGFERDLQYVRNGQYTYIWIFSRKDGKPLDKVDGAFLRKNAPQVVDWVTTEEGKKVIAGTNFNLEEGNLELIKKRFVTEDYSAR
ncbi:MAG: hypothetical protein ABR555_13780 [Pyrinomonadaceae bacterium]